MDSGTSVSQEALDALKFWSTFLNNMVINQDPLLHLQVLQILLCIQWSEYVMSLN